MRQFSLRRHCRGVSFGKIVLGYFGHKKGTQQNQINSFNNFMTPYRR